MASSIDRVKAALSAAGLKVEVMTMPASTRTAQEAADACGCNVAQIVKSLVFEGADTGALVLLLVSGRNQVDMDRAREVVGEPLKRADIKRVRDETGFAIGGVAPLGHTAPLRTWIDETLLEFDAVWAAAGAPNTVFEIDPVALKEAIGAPVAKLA
jgi:prolyl-tRNA editing enzyme YbaK/EbsC (Cys-tRNA(Pro) deacylase)